MKKNLVLVSLVLLFLTIPGCQKRDAEKSETITYTEKDPEFSTHKSVTRYYDKEGKLTRQLFILSDKMAEQSGFYSQEEIYNDPEGPKFVLNFTENNSEITGIKTIIELVDENDVSKRLTYYDGKYFANEDPASFSVNYDAYSMKYIKQEMEKIEKDGPVTDITVSAQFPFCKSFVTCTSDPEPLDSKDLEICKSFFKFMNKKDYSHLFSKKINAVSEGIPVVIYLQSNIEMYFKKDVTSFLSYGFIQAKDRYYLLSAAVSDTFTDGLIN